MGKAIKMSKALAQIWNSCLRDKINMRNQNIAIDKDIAITFDTSYQGAYTGPSKDGKKYRITIGGKLVGEIAKCPETIRDKKDLVPYWYDIVDSFYGLNYHEMGHILFTDMSDKRICEYPEAKFRGFLHQLFNLMEDPVVEFSMSHMFDIKYPGLINPREHFEVVINAIFMPQCKDYKDHEDLGSFMQYLLLSMRCGRKAIPTTNAVFEKYKSGLLPLLKEIIYEVDATERVGLTIKLGEWIIENIKEFHFEDLPEPEKKISGGDPGDPTRKPKKAPKREPDDPGDPTRDPGDPTEPGDPTDGEEKETPPIGKEGEEKEETPPPPTVERPIDIDETDIDEVFVDRFSDGSDHQWCLLKDVCDPDPDCEDIVDGWIESFKDTVNDVSKFLNLFHARIRPRATEGFTRGKLNIRRVMKDEAVDGCDTKIFNQDVRRGKAPDVCISLLCDNSGSMHGGKAAICAKAAAVLGQAAEWAGVPFECNAFTKTLDTSYGTSITLKIKQWNESFNNSKAYWVANSYEYHGKLNPTMRIPFFSGNSEEINLYHIWNELKKVEHKTKVLFVLCDGCTTGSKQELKQLITDMEEDNIVVIGIGICDTEVANIYSNSKVFGTMSDLETGLADYLVETLSRYAK